MRIKLISLFLLFLFSVVMAFPGYGNGVSSLKNKAAQSAKFKSASPVTWKTVLKKCLAKGINMIEEERNIEEDEDSPCSKEVCYLISFQQALHPLSEILFNTYLLDEHCLVNLRAVPSPPPNFC